MPIDGYEVNMAPALGFFSLLVGLTCLFVIIPIQAFRKKPLKIPVGIGFSSLILAIAAMVAIPRAPEPTPTQAEWKKHRDYIIALTNDAFLAKTPLEAYIRAGKVLDDPHFKSCRFGGCLGAKAALRDLRRASEDGRITPGELEDMRGWRGQMLSNLNEREAEIGRTIASQPKQ